MALSDDATFQPVAPPARPTAVAINIVPTASPFTYTAPYSMLVIISGGTLSAISFKRGATVAALGLTNTIIPLEQGDAFTLTYLTAPTITGFPR